MMAAVTIWLIHSIYRVVIKRKLMGGNMQIVDLPVGAEGDVKVVLAGGVLSISASENTPGLQGSLQVNVPLTYFIDALVVKLGNTATEQAIGALLDSVLKGLA